MRDIQIFLFGASALIVAGFLYLAATDAPAQLSPSQYRELVKN